MKFYLCILKLEFIYPNNRLFFVCEIIRVLNIALFGQFILFTFISLQYYNDIIPCKIKSVFANFANYIFAEIVIYGVSMTLMMAQDHCLFFFP